MDTPLHTQARTKYMYKKWISAFLMTLTDAYQV